MKIGRLLALLVFWLSLSSVGFAQTLVTPDAFLDAVEGRSATFIDQSSGRLVGDEYFIDRRQTVWQPAHGACVYGVMELRGDQLCFHYPTRDTPACWWVFQTDGVWMVRNAGRVFGAQVQIATDIRDAPLACESAPTS